jgi:hypothetical protein
LASSDEQIGQLFQVAALTGELNKVLAECPAGTAERYKNQISKKDAANAKSSKGPATKGRPGKKAPTKKDPGGWHDLTGTKEEKVFAAKMAAYVKAAMAMTPAERKAQGISLTMFPAKTKAAGKKAAPKKASESSKSTKKLESNLSEIRKELATLRQQYRQMAAKAEASPGGKKKPTAKKKAASKEEQAAMKKVEARLATLNKAWKKGELTDRQHAAGTSVIALHPKHNVSPDQLTEDDGAFTDGSEAIIREGNPILLVGPELSPRHSRTPSSTQRSKNPIDGTMVVVPERRMPLVAGPADGLRYVIVVEDNNTGTEKPKYKVLLVSGGEWIETFTRQQNAVTFAKMLEQRFPAELKNASSGKQWSDLRLDASILKANLIERMLAEELAPVSKEGGPDRQPPMSRFERPATDAAAAAKKK